MKTSITILLALVLVSKTGYARSFAPQANQTTYSSKRTGGGPVLSITLSQFEAQTISPYTTHIIWKTMMEMKVDYFNVQRSADGTNFQTIGQLDSKMTDSTSAYELNYDYTDASTLPGTSYYRLQIVDRNGFSNYSAVIHISNNQATGIKIFPTIVNNTNLFVETDKPIRNARLEFFDLSGKKIGETSWETLNGKQSLQPVTNMRAMATGTYLARLSAHGEILVNQLLIFQTH